MAAPDVGWAELIELLGALDQVVVLVGRDRRIRFVNRLEEGYERDQVMGADIFDFIAPEAREAQADLLDRAFAAGEPYSYEIPMVDSAGEQQWYEGRTVPLARDGEVTLVAVVTRNVTERHRAQEEVEQLRSLLPICSWCKRIRDDRGRWHDLEEFISLSSGAALTHGVCPRCEREMLGGADGTGG